MLSNSKGDDYDTYILSSAVNTKTFKQYISSPKEKATLLRHDVDMDIDRALDMAIFESKRGVYSTYFLLHTAKYFNYSKEFAQKCKKIVSLGHDIGLHNNALTVYFKRKKDIRRMLEMPLKFLRDNGIDVVGTSAHGVKACYTRGYFNYEIWKEFDPKRNEGKLKVPIHKIGLHSLGLIYDASFVDFDFYLSDSGDTWNGMVVKIPIPFEKTLKYGPDNIGLAVLEKFQKSKKGTIQILTHPFYWN